MSTRVGAFGYEWYVLTDGIMGGRSSGTMGLLNSGRDLYLRADINTNGGGFCTFNTVPMTQNLHKFNNIGRIVITAKIEEENPTKLCAFKLTLATNEFSEMSEGVWSQAFDKAKRGGENRDTFIFDQKDFKLTRRGVPTDGSGFPVEIGTLGIMVSYVNNATGKKIANFESGGYAITISNIVFQ